MDEENIEKALKWIVEILQKHNIPFQLTGGFAARLYGSKGFREGAEDIDIDISESRFGEIMDEVKDYIVKGPERYYDDFFDCNLLTLNYAGRNIDLGDSDDCKIFDKKKNQWVKCESNYAKSKNMEIFGIKVPVIAKEDLIEYKEILGRSDDLEDLKYLK